MERHVILGVHITDRLRRAGEVQRLLSEYGCSIKTRLGLHDTAPGACSPNGLLILEMVGDPAAATELAAMLGAVAGVEVKQMVFDHP